MKIKKQVQETNEVSSIYDANITIEEGGTGLLIVDPQNDFHPGGSLAIETADEDAARIAALIKSNLLSLSHIYVTLDSHQKYHIAHPLFWVNARNEHPEPFTTITKKMVETGEWKTKRKEHQAWGLRYVTQLAEKGNFELTIWPEHCLIGTSGHNVRQVIQDALHEWEEVQGKAVTYVMKGNNSKSEHYSAIKAEVIVPGDEWNTSLNNVLLNELKRHMRLLICGQASSHCVNFTVRDIADNWKASDLKRLEILQDAMSPVSGFNDVSAKFFKEMGNKGLKITKTSEIEIKPKA